MTRVTILFALVVLIGILVAGCVTKSPFVEPAHSTLTALTTGQPDVKVLNSKAALPVSVQALLSAMADVGEPFSADCTGPNPRKRFLAAKAAGRTYYVAIEEGGVAYKWFINRYVVDETDKVIETKRIDSSTHPAEWSNPRQ